MITLSRDVVRLIQTELNLPENQRDGIIGSGTEDAIRDFLRANKSKLDPNHADAILSAGRKRIAIAFGQLKALEKDIDVGKVDGFLGPQTNVALEDLVFLLENKRLPIPFRDHEVPSASRWPIAGSSEFSQRFGSPGVESNLVKIHPPYPHLYNGSPVSGIRIHKEVAGSLEKILKNVLQEYGQQRISELGLDIYGGSYNNRNMRGGTSKSMHAWGIAIDYDPNRNELNWGQDRAVFAKSEYDKWWDIWEAEGWVSLGRVRNFDWMHVQAARLKGM